MRAALIFAAALAAVTVSSVSAQETEEPEETAAPAPETPPEPAAAAPAVAASGVSRLQGTAYLGRNRQVVGATVTVLEEQDPSVVFLTSTDEKGAFRIGELANGSYRVEVRREGLAPVVKTGVSVRFPFRAVIELPMTPAVSGPEGIACGVGSEDRITVRGAAHDRDGAPLRQARVRLVSPLGVDDPREVLTAADGTFFFDDLPAGGWRLEVRAVGYLPIRAAIEAGRATDLRLGLVRQPAGYVPSPLDLMPEEEPIPPAGLGEATP